jgi:hypothetical protein
MLSNRHTYRTLQHPPCWFYKLMHTRTQSMIIWISQRGLYYALVYPGKGGGGVILCCTDRLAYL